MWVLLGVSDDTVEKETFVYFIGVFSLYALAMQERDKLAKDTNTKISDYIIKKIEVNKSYSYDWSNSEEDEVKC